MRERAAQPDAFFFAHRGGKGAEGELAELFADYTAVADTHPYWRDDAPQSMVIDEVEAIWSAIDERDDWQPLEDKVNAIRRMGQAHGRTPASADHA
jgi:hypothetical protein